jgi:hypothetical protein
MPILAIVWSKDYYPNCISPTDRHTRNDLIYQKPHSSIINAPHTPRITQGRSTYTVIPKAKVPASFGKIQFWMKSDQRQRFHNYWTFLLLSTLALVYSSWLHYQTTLTGRNDLDGVLGVLLGLYICSHPAANMLDMLFFKRSTEIQGFSKQSNLLWVVANILVFVMGWMVIVVGTTRFVSKTA